MEGANRQETSQEATCRRRNVEGLQAIIEDLQSLIDENMMNLQAIVNKLLEIESVLHSYSIHRINGKITGITGGVLIVAGLCLAPFTLGISVAVVGAATLVGITGGIVQAVNESQITKMMSAFEERIGKLVADFQTCVTPIQNLIFDIERDLKKNKSSHQLSVNSNVLKQDNLKLCSDSIDYISLALRCHAKTEITVTTETFQKVVNKLRELKSEF